MQFKLAAVSALLATAANGYYLPATQQDVLSITQQPLIQAPEQGIAAARFYQLNDEAAAAFWADRIQKDSLSLKETTPVTPLGETAVNGENETGNGDQAVGMDVVGGNASPYGSQASSTVAPTTAAPIPTTAATTLASPTAPTPQSGYAIPQEQHQSDLSGETIAPVAPTSTIASSTVPTQAGGNSYESGFVSSTEASTVAATSTLASVTVSTPQAAYAAPQEQSQSDLSGETVAPVAPTAATSTVPTSQAGGDSYGSGFASSTEASTVAATSTLASVTASTPQTAPQQLSVMDAYGGSPSVIAPVAPTTAPTSTVASTIQAGQDSYGSQPANTVASAATAGPQAIPQKPMRPQSGSQPSGTPRGPALHRRMPAAGSNNY